MTRLIHKLMMVVPVEEHIFGEELENGSTCVDEENLSPAEAQAPAGNMPSRLAAWTGI
jgi:hypothetical protein